jgi:hypothetical protein
MNCHIYRRPVWSITYPSLENRFTLNHEKVDIYYSIIYTFSECIHHTVLWFHLRGFAWILSTAPSFRLQRLFSVLWVVLIWLCSICIALQLSGELCLQHILPLTWNILAGYITMRIPYLLFPERARHWSFQMAMSPKNTRHTARVWKLFNLWRDALAPVMWHLIARKKGKHWPMRSLRKPIPPPPQDLNLLARFKHLFKDNAVEL